MKGTMETAAANIEQNRFVRLARRAAIEGWTIERANEVISSLQLPDMPTWIEMDEARDLIGTLGFTFDLAAAVDLLFDAHLPGIPQDPDHNFGNVQYYLAVAWLKRVEEGELLAVDFVSRHCRLSKDFYVSWEPLVNGAPGHPTWADVRVLEAQLLWQIAKRRSAPSNLKEAVKLFDEARLCYPPNDRYWPVLALETCLLAELAECEEMEANLRKALELSRLARNCIDLKDPQYQPVLAQELRLWDTMLNKHLTRSTDKERIEEFINRALAETESSSVLRFVIGCLHKDFVKTHSKRSAILANIWHDKRLSITRQEFSARIQSMIGRIFYD